MNVSPRDKRALVWLGLASVFALTVWFWPESTGSVERPVNPGDLPLAERRLARLRQTAAAGPGREQVLKETLADLGRREAGIIQADTAAQAQAQVLQVVRRLTRAQAPPLELSGVEIGPARPFGNDYGEVLVSVSFQARIDQLLNLLADLASQPELLATEELRIGGATTKQKVMTVRLTVSGLVPRKLIPVKKGFAF
ncbi:MAG: hypothetical protein HY822_22040 [Acidobacteria bacterium]|nr:hypothetical protein [Acidobacteriota bacterium]